MSRPAPLLTAKLLPPTPRPLHLPRPRLTDRIMAGLEARATVVTAGPGYGKTTMVARALQDHSVDSVWYRLDAGDRDPWVFFRYLALGVKEHAPEFGESTGGVWEDMRARPLEVERLADVFIKDAEDSLGGRLVVVLDDVHQLEQSPECARALRRLLTYLPGALHLILIGRSIPEIGLSSLQAEEAVRQVHGEELLFTLEETRTLLLETFGLEVPSATIERVQARTRGWITALQLLRQTARLDTEVPEGVFTRTEAEIFDYFSQEVLTAETPETREFLLGSSPPAIVDPEVCVEVLPNLDVRAQIRHLIRRNLFIAPLESRGEYYTYDPLFLDFLRRTLRSERGEAGARELDQRYGRAYGRRGDPGRALAHLVSAEDPRGVAALLGRHGRALLRTGLLGAVRAAAEFLERRGVRPALVDDLLGEASRIEGDHAAAVGRFERALAEPGAGGAAVHEAGGRERAATLQGLAYSLLKLGDAERAERAAVEALGAAGQGDPGLEARVLNTLAILRARQNRHDEAVSGWRQALALARQAGDEHLTLMIAHNLGLPHALAGDFRRASECFRILTGPDNRRLGPEEGAAYLNLAQIALLQGESARAAAHLGDAREIARKWHLAALEADVVQTEGTLLRETGDLEAARERYERARALYTGLGRADLLDSLTEEEALLAARAGRHAEAEILAAGVVARRRAAADEEGIASALLALGEVRLRDGRAAEAAESLDLSAGAFRTLGRAYQECMARLLLSQAFLQSGARGRAEEAAGEGLRLAARYEYQAAVERIAGLDAGFGAFLAARPESSGMLSASAAIQAAPVRARPAVVAGGPDLTIRLLGPVEVYRDPDCRIPAQAWKIRRALQIFCYLAAARDHRALKDRIADAVWGDARPSVIEKNLHPTFTLLRRALNHGHGVPKNFIVCERGAYRLNPAYRYDIDTESFEAGLAGARREAAAGRPDAALAEYGRVLALYRGPFLEEEYNEWAEAPRTRYELLHLAALVEAGELHLKVGEHEPAVAAFRRLTEHDPLDEESSVRLMRALGATAGRAAVEKEFARLTRDLAEDLDTEPLPETRRAFENALSGRTGGKIAPTSAPREKRR